MPEIERLRQHGLCLGARVFDMGAHQGVVALILADAVGDGGARDRGGGRAAQRTRRGAQPRLNAAQNVEIIHAAGAANEGTVLFAEGLNGHVDDGGSTWGKVEVAAMTIDGLAARHGRPDVVLIDVEGFGG